MEFHQMFSRHSRVIGGVNARIHFTILPSVVECQCTEMKMAYANFCRFVPKIGYHSNVPSDLPPWPNG